MESINYMEIASEFMSGEYALKAFGMVQLFPICKKTCHNIQLKKSTGDTLLWVEILG